MVGLYIHTKKTCENRVGPVMLFYFNQNCDVGLPACYCDPCTYDWFTYWTFSIKGAAPVGPKKGVHYAVLNGHVFMSSLLFEYDT